MKTFPVGAKVLVDGRDKAIVKQAFPEGSSSYLFPHYKLDFVGGDKNVAVAMNRVGVVKARLDADKAAKPLTEIHAEHPTGVCVMPGINALSYEIKDK